MMLTLKQWRMAIISRLPRINIRHLPLKTFIRIIISLSFIGFIFISIFSMLMTLFA